MAFGILKLSYNRGGESSVVGGICGTGFFVNPSMAITAHHVLNENTFRPNDGFRYSRVWTLSRNGLVTLLEERFVEVHPEIDTTVIKFGKPLAGIKVYTLSDCSPTLMSQVYGIGHIGEAMPQLDVGWEGEVLTITSADLDSVVCDKKGHIKRAGPRTVNASVKLQNIEGFEVSFGSRVGMSGGPLIRPC